MVAGVIFEPDSGRVLVARRPESSHQGGKWEFPGGKVARGENQIAALKRELVEELGLQVQDCEPLIQVTHAYPEVTVQLDFWKVVKWQGQPLAREGQLIDWVAVQELDSLEFPEANVPLIELLQQRHHS